MSNRIGQYENNPTPEEIRRECAEIQATWTPFEENRHRAEAYRTKPLEMRSVRSRPGGSVEQSE